MAFANLFTRLSAVEEAVTSPGQPAFTHRNETDSGKRGNARKRKNKAEPTGPDRKKQCYQAQTTRSYHATSFKDNDFGFTKEVTHNHSDKANHNNMCHKGQIYKTKKNCNVNKQQQKKKLEGQKNQHQQKERRPANRGGSHQTGPTWRKGGGYSKNKNDKQDVQVKQTRFMTQEFKDQNALLVDGRLVCRHFLWGRCIKDADCQLEHIQGYNDLIKEVCKFYVQGLCTKGESCPYMHKSFPCKFFHRKGRCSQGADCRFSHEPLNDVTNRLLDEALKQEKDLYELTKKAEQDEQESSGQPESTDSAVIEANKTPDTLLQPLKPSFYNSLETNAEKETLLCQTEEVADITEEAVPQHASDDTQPHIPPSSNLNHKEPVCYSVAAVLGPQLFKPFPSYFPTQGSQESVPLSSSDCISGSANQSEAPYSVDAVIRSCKLVENSTFGHTPTSTAKTASYTPKTDFDKITDLYSVNTRNEVNKSQEKMFKSQSPLQVHTSLIPKTCPSLTLASKDHKEQRDDMPESLKPAQRAAHEVKLEFLPSPVTVAEKLVSSKNKGDMKRSMKLPTDITCSINCKNEDVLPFGRTNSTPPTRTSTTKRPTQLKPHGSVLTSDSQAPKKLYCPFSGSTEFEGGAAVPVEPVTSSVKTRNSANSDSCHFAAKQPPDVHPHSKKTQSGLNCDTQQNYSTNITAEGSSKMAHSGDLTVGCKKPLKRPFHSHFASPLTHTLQPVDNSVSNFSFPQGLIQSSCSAPQSTDCKSSGVKSVAEPDKASARSFLSLFAAPLSAAPLPCMQSQPDHSRTSSCSQKSYQSVDNTSRSSNSKQRASNLETPFPHQVRTDVKEISDVQRSPNFSPNPKIGNEDSSTELISQPTKQQVNPVCSLMSSSLGEMSNCPTPCGNSPSATHPNQQLPDISSQKGSAAAATANSVLKTLFVCLRPYQQDGEQQDSIQISDPSDSRFPVQQSSEKTVTHSAEHQPS